MAFHIKERLQNYTNPFQPIAFGLQTLYGSITAAFRAGGVRAVLDFRGLQDAEFYGWFKALNDRFLQFEATTAVPELVPRASGIVLELGPGLGNQLPRFDLSKVARIVGVESNPLFAIDIEKQVRESGLGDIYDLAICSVDDAAALERHGIVANSVDTIVSIQVLCSVPDAKATAKTLYRLLKPGGRLIFWEHHRNTDPVTAAVQYFWNPLWHRLVGGCKLTQNMQSIILDAGEWGNLGSLAGDQQPWSMLPHVWGELRKPLKAGETI